MIILDTNVLSALMRDVPDRSVVAWLDDMPSESVWTTSVTVFEIRFGIELLPPGRRRRSLEEAFVRSLEVDLEGRVLPFDDVAAQAAGAIGAGRRRMGRPVDFRDVQIAGIALAHKATLATRNTKDFDALELALVDPWSR